MIYVVGSGPAGVSCAIGLLHAGAKVTVLDAGEELEVDRRALLKNLIETSTSGWTPERLAFLKPADGVGLGKIPKKLAYGSDFPYRDTGNDIPLLANRVDCLPSLAKGGLSNVWGAAVLPYRDADIPDWPISAEALARHYRAVLRFMALSARCDDLADIFPLYTDHPCELPPSRQAVAFLEDLTTHRRALASSGLFFGYSRLAVSTGCVSCGQCLYGCPYELIYNSAKTLDELRERSLLTYIPGVIVDRVEETNRSVKIIGHRHLTRDPFSVDAERVYLACGVLSTTRILLDSMEADNRELTIKDSHYFLLPLVRFREVSHVAQEHLHTLSQIFLEIIDPQISERTIHLQVYTYNDMYEAALRQSLGKAYGLIADQARKFLGRLLLVQGYLDSTRSPAATVALIKDPKTGKRQLLLKAVENPKTQVTVRAVIRKLRKNSRRLRAFPLSIMRRSGNPGRGFHSGGTFPMREQPGEFETDQFGRPSGFRKIHAVDSSIFPSIPATTITFTVMANAHRIGASLGEYA
jgi:choline dehydrogenase-like flavoprotein